MFYEIKWHNFAVTSLLYIYVTGEMDLSGESVPPGTNLTGGMEPGMDTNI